MNSSLLFLVFLSIVSAEKVRQNYDDDYYEYGKFLPLGAGGGERGAGGDSEFRELSCYFITSAFACAVHFALYIALKTQAHAAWLIHLMELR